MATTVHVSNISTKTTEDEIKSFFSFCGKIHSISVKPSDNETQSAEVTFEKSAAAKTALLLDNTQLGPNSVHVTSAKSIDELEDEKSPSSDESKEGDHHLEQEEKPRSRIFAEYLAQGYAISDKAIEKALALDQQHGVSSRFVKVLQDFDQKFHATEKAQAVDAKFSITERLNAGWRGLYSYFDKAVETPTGQKLRDFYNAGNKTVTDVHNEALHLLELKKQQQGGDKPSAEQANVHQVPGTDKTKCSCSNEGNCACPPGKCACDSCGKKESAPATATS